jgi:hypothetical protein
MLSVCMAEEIATDPSQDPAFSHLVSAWTDGTLGFYKDEGIGLLWKEGLVSDLLVAMFRRAPRTMHALGSILAKDAPAFAADDSYVPGRLVAEFVAIMDLPLTERRERFDALDLAEPAEEFPSTLRAIEPPMERRFARALESWVETAAGIEARLDAPKAEQAAAPLVAGAVVRHAKWGEGTITGVSRGDPPVVTVRFASVGDKKLSAAFLSRSK